MVRLVEASEQMLYNILWMADQRGCLYLHPFWDREDNLLHAFIRDEGYLAVIITGDLILST